MPSIDSSNHVGFSIRIEGIDEVRAALRALPEKLERNVVRGGLRAAAKIVADEAKRLVPVRRGVLQKSIRISSRVKNGLVTVSVKAGGKGARHAHLVELGTKPHLIGRRGFKVAAIRHPGAKPKPYMKPAFERKVRAAIDTFVDYVHRRLPKELEKLNGGRHG
jgi:HK97 gp10 family phage protein